MKKVLANSMFYARALGSTAATIVAVAARLGTVRAAQAP